jgi:hypothetical protein
MREPIMIRRARAIMLARPIRDERKAVLRRE